MKHELKNYNLYPILSDIKLLHYLASLYWLYKNFCVGYFFSRVFYIFYDGIELKKKFTLKNIIKIIIDFLTNWVIRVRRKCQLCFEAISHLKRGLKFLLKSDYKLKTKFLLLHRLLWKTFLVFCSLMGEVFYFKNIRKWIYSWLNLIQFLMEESVLITGLVYVLYLILLAIFGIWLGFLVGIYSPPKKEDEINAFIFLLLLLLEIFSNHEFYEILLKLLKIDRFSKLSFEVLELSNSPLSKIVMPQSNKEFEFLFPAFKDDSIIIDVDFMFDESISYEFELFKIDRDISQKVKIK